MDHLLHHQVCQLKNLIKDQDQMQPLPYKPLAQVLPSEDTKGPNLREVRKIASEI